MSESPPLRTQPPSMTAPAFVLATSRASAVCFDHLVSHAASPTTLIPRRHAAVQAYLAITWPGDEGRGQGDSDPLPLAASTSGGGESAHSAAEPLAPWTPERDAPEYERVSPGEIELDAARRQSRRRDGGADGVFVGREHELTELTSGLEDALSGLGRLFLLRGEPGIGKSRVAHELATIARDRGARVLRGRCWEGAGAPAYWPWMQAIRAYVRAADPEAVRHQIAGGGPDIVQMLPELHRLFPKLASPPSTDPDSARFRLFDSTASFLVNAAAAQPLVVVLDDLHAADTASLLLLRFVAEVLAEARILVVGAYRDLELTREHPLTKLVTELGREPITRELHLRGLEQGTVGEFIRATGGVEPHALLVAALYRETGGNPLFLGEAVRLLVAEGRLGMTPEPGVLRVAVPSRIREVIARRVGHLSESCRLTLTVGSVLGPEFSLEVVGRVGESSREALDEAVREGLLAEVPGELDRFRFSHDLVREALYEELSSAQRARLHRRAAEVVEEVFATELEPHLAQLAHHWFEAARGGDPGKAVEYGRRAGDQAVSSLAYEEAARLYRMALQALELEGSAQEHVRAELLLAQGGAGARAGDFAGAKELFLRAASIARRTGEPTQLARAALGHGGRFVWTRAGSDPDLVPMLQDALVLLGGSDDHLRVRLLSRLACALRSSPDREHSAALSQQAVDLARRVEDPSSLAYALSGRYAAVWWPENPDERLEIGRELVRVAEDAGDGERSVEGYMATFTSLADLGRMAEARIELEALQRRVEDLRQPAHRVMALGIWTELALLEGSFDTAEELIGEAVRFPATTPARDNVASLKFQLFLLRREQGRLAEIEKPLRAAFDDFPWYPMFRLALIRLLLDVGRRSEGHSAFHELARNNFRDLYRDNYWLLGMSLASEACSELGDAEAAAILYEQLLPFPGRNSRTTTDGSVGAVDRYLALLARTLGRLDDAEVHFQGAVGLNERMGARPWLARTQDDYARMLLARDGPGDRQRATELLTAARDTCAELGMALEKPILGLLTDLGVEASSATVAAAHPPANAEGPHEFRREGEYFSIVFEGDSFRLRDTKGLRHIARLLASPGREVHSLDLVATASGSARPATTSPPDHEDRLHAGFPTDAGEILDLEARDAYGRRLEELREELEEAKSWGDTERAARARAEREFLVRELAAAVGLGGRGRPAASPAERARQSVTKTIKAAMVRISEESPSLGRHLASTIHTGTFCRYEPDTRAPIAWRL
jgi:tetratricopeptide (TPR) repeat protein